MRAAREPVEPAVGKRGVGMRVARSTVRGIVVEAVSMRVRMRMDVRAVCMRMLVNASAEGAMETPHADANQNDAGNSLAAGGERCNRQPAAEQQREHADRKNAARVAKSPQRAGPP